MSKETNGQGQESLASASGCAQWWSAGWQRLMDIATWYSGEKTAKYQPRHDKIYERTMSAHERIGHNDPSSPTGAEKEQSNETR